MAMWAQSLRACNGGCIYRGHRLNLGVCCAAGTARWSGPVSHCRAGLASPCSEDDGGDCAAEQYSAGSVPLLAFAILRLDPRGIGHGRGGALYQFSDVLRAPNGRARAKPVGRRVSPHSSRPPTTKIGSAALSGGWAGRLSDRRRSAKAGETRSQELDLRGSLRTLVARS